MKIKSKIAIILPIVLVCVLAAILCLVIIPNQPDSISLAIDDVSMICGEVKDIEYSCSDENAEISFDSYNSKIVEVDGDKIIAKKVGSTAIRVKAQSENATAYSSFKVIVSEDTTMALTTLPEEITLYLLDKNFEQARADGYDNVMTYVRLREISSVDSCKFVKVTANKITASKAGSGEVVFHGTSGDKQTIKVNVLAIAPTIVNLPNQININPKDSYEINFTLAPSYYTGDASVEISSLSECLTVDGNIIAAKTSGEGKVTVSVGDENYTIAVSVASQIKYVLTAFENCRVEGNRIYVHSGEEACFMLELSTLSNEPVAFSSVEFSTNGVEIKREVNNINFSSTSGGVITIYSSSLLSYAHFYVCVY